MCPQEYIIILTKIVTHDVPTLMQDWCYMYLKLNHVPIVFYKTSLTVASVFSMVSYSRRYSDFKN